MTAITADLHPFARPAGSGEPPVWSLRATCSALPEGGIRLTFALAGRLNTLRVPAQDEPAAWPLWQHTCFEAFLSVPGQERYREINFSPAGLWVVSAFRRYREIEHEWTHQLAASAPPAIETERHSDALRLAAGLPPALLPDGPVLQMGLSAVIERLDGQIEYWALRHPVAGRADFHHPDGWTLRLNTRSTPP